MSGNSNEVIPNVRALCKPDASLKLAAQTLQSVRKAYAVFLATDKRKNELHQNNFNRIMVIALWTLHHASWSKMHGSSISLGDLLFICACYDAVARNPKPFAGIEQQLHETANVQQLLREVRFASIQWKRRRVSEQELDELFLRVAALVVFGFEYGIEYMESLTAKTYVYKNNPYRDVESISGLKETRDDEGDKAPDASDSKFAAQVGVPAGQGQREDEKAQYKARELENLKSAAIAQETAVFISWSARLFLHVWTELALFVKPFDWDPTKEPELSDRLKSWKKDWPACRQRMDTWMKRQTSDKPTVPFLTFFRDFCFRVRAGVGALSFYNRFEVLNLGGSSLFHQDVDDEKLSELEHKHMDRDPKAIWQDSKSEHRDALLLCMFSRMTDCSTRIGSFMDRYVVLEPQLLDKKKQLYTDSKDGVPRLPLILQVRGGYHVLHENRLLWCDDAMDALLLWMSIVQKDHDSKLEDGVTLDHEQSPWISLFLGKPVSVDNPDLMRDSNP